MSSRLTSFPVRPHGPRVSAVFASLLLRVGYSPDFAAPAVDTDTFVRRLNQTAVRYLFGRE